MLTPERMRSIVLQYIERVRRNDVEGVVSLFADTISLEDPVGGPPDTHVVGRENVRNFFQQGFAQSRPEPTLTGPVVTTAGNETAVPFTLRLQLGDEPHEIDVIDVIQFDSEGQITSLRAFWNYRERRQCPKA